MDYLICKIKTRSTENLRLVLSDLTVYANITIDSSFEFNDEYKLQDREWFCIEKFSEKPYFLEWLGPTFNAVDYEDIKMDERTKIVYLVAVQNEGNEYNFQRILDSGRILSRKYLSLSKKISIDNVENLLVINNVPDAIYKKEEDRLYFRDIGRVRPIFRGIEDLLKEATEREVLEFMNIDMLEIDGSFDVSKVSVSNRRRIRLAKRQFDTFDDNQKKILKGYIRDYCPELTLDEINHRYLVENDDKLKKFIYAVDQRFYSTPIDNQKRMATSIQII